MEKCNLCPRKCNIDRSKNVGFCGVGNDIYIAKVMLHHFEEPCISGSLQARGSGAIFFAGCNLKCVFCQNKKISRGAYGTIHTPKTLANIFKELESQGAYNINLVTPSHYTRQIIEALDIYKPNIPIVWNSSGYESYETILSLKGYVDIFLVDFKYYSDTLALKYSKAQDYLSNIQKVLPLMRNIQPKDTFKDGLMQKGIIVRHLLLPTHIEDSYNVLNEIKRLIGYPILSLMSQYTPMEEYLYKELNQHIRPLEYKLLIKRALSLGFDKIYTQELDSASSVYTPDF